MLPGRLCFLQLADCFCASFAEYFDKHKLDKCPVACESIEYSAQLSYAMFPSNVEGDRIAKQRKLGGSRAENRQFLRYGFVAAFECA